MQHLLFFLLLICYSHSWKLETTHRQVTSGITKNVSLECRYDKQDNKRPHMEIVMRIIIHKFRGSDQWDTVAKIIVGNQIALPGEGVGSDVILRGHIGTTENSFLSMTWPLSSSNTTGQYACEINGDAQNDNIVRVVTDPISIIESQLSLEYLLSMVLDLKEQTEKNSRHSSRTLNSIQELKMRIDEDFDTLKRDINATQDMVNDIPNVRRKLTKAEISPIVDAKLKDNWYERRNWPDGQYALLNPTAGCPTSNTTNWIDGYIKFHSESTQGKRFDEVSEPNNLAKPVLEKNMSNHFVYIRTCKRAIDASGPAWPKGSYCIHRAGGSCPAGFADAKVQLDAEDSPKLKGDFYNAPDVQMDTSFEYQILFFCCRDDGDPTSSIILPMDTPFYLYRYKGTCQSVQDAKVSGEWIQIATEDHGNQDKYYTKIFPDSTLNPIRFFLCYYAN